MEGNLFILIAREHYVKRAHVWSTQRSAILTQVNDGESALATALRHTKA